MSNAPLPAAGADLAVKITRLAEERGWNQEDFARIAGLNRQTVRQIMIGGEHRRLRNATVLACANALGLGVADLRTLPLERLLPRMHGKPADAADDALGAMLSQATLPDLRAWLERNPQRARHFTPDEQRELLSLQGENGPLAGFGVERFVDLIERRRALVQRVQAVAGSEYLPLLEQLVGLLYEKVRPGG